MYPNLYYAFKDIFGVDWQRLRFINSFGFFVALAFLAGAYILTRELKRKERLGLLHGEDVKIMVGQPATAGELLLNFLLGFLLGFKIVGLFFADGDIAADPQQYIFSANGNWLAGIVLGILFAVMKWLEKNKQKLSKPEERTIRIWPHDGVGDIVIYAALFGFLGAKVFHNLENWKEFSANPIESLLSFSGLTFYGGLICGTIAIIYYARKHHIGIRHLADCMGPTLILAYAVGRIGCQVAGDGDWGILNSAYITTPDSKVVLSDSARFKSALLENSALYKAQFEISDPLQSPHLSVTLPGLPQWMVAYQYPHNVVNDGVKIAGCNDQYCKHLPIPVFPTPFYETVLCLLIFGILMAIRSKLRIPGTVFAVYLIFNGIERFLIEKIRVNTKYDIYGQPTQAELISSMLVIIGVLLYFYLARRHKREL